MSPIKPTSSEEEYFAREDAEKKRKLQADQAKEMSAAEREEIKKLPDREKLVLSLYYDEGLTLA